eukprot:3751220-Rhodomonas_salina.1
MTPALAAGACSSKRNGCLGAHTRVPGIGIGYPAPGSPCTGSIGRAQGVPSKETRMRAWYKILGTFPGIPSKIS